MNNDGPATSVPFFPEAAAIPESGCPLQIKSYAPAIPVMEDPTWDSLLSVNPWRLQTQVHPHLRSAPASFRMPQQASNSRPDHAASRDTISPARFTSNPTPSRMATGAYQLWVRPQLLFNDTALRPSSAPPPASGRDGKPPRTHSGKDTVIRSPASSRRRPTSPGSSLEAPQSRCYSTSPIRA